MNFNRWDFESYFILYQYELVFFHGIFRTISPNLPMHTDLKTETETETIPLKKLLLRAPKLHKLR